jgi:hypothetical protein
MIMPFLGERDQVIVVWRLVRHRFNRPVGAITVRHPDLNAEPTNLLHQIRSLAHHINTLTTPLR